MTPAGAAKRRRELLVGLLLVGGATLGWALSGLFLRLIEEKDSWQVNGLRGFSFAIWMALWCLIRYRQNLVQAFRAIPLSALILCPAFFAVGSSLYLWALSLTSIAAASCLGATGPLFAAGLAYLAIGERSPPVVLLAALVALGGVALMVADGLTASSDALPLTGIGLAAALGYAFCFAGQTVALRKYSGADVTPAFILGGLLCAVMIFAIRGLADFSWHDIGLIALMGLLQLTIPIALYARGARYLPAVTLMLVSLLDTVLNPLFAWVVVDEVPSWNTIYGGAIIVGAVALSVIARAKAKSA